VRPDRFRVFLSKRWSKRIKNNLEELQELKGNGTATPTSVDLIKKRRLDAEVARLPIDPQIAMPTLLGNLLRSAEEYPKVRYGLSALPCWPRLYHLLPDILRQSITNERRRLNESSRLFAWCVLFQIWLFWGWWWALVAMPIAWSAYRGMVSAAVLYGDTIRTAFDLHRFDLYRGLSWPLPKCPADEENSGKELSLYLFRGVAPADSAFKFVHTKSADEEKQLRD
jgi:hypothetical protein